MAKQFHISDVLSVTTGRLVSTRHIQGVYEILNFLTGDKLFTHQLPRAMRECEPWLATQFPKLMKDNPEMVALLGNLDNVIAAAKGNKDYVSAACDGWVQTVRAKLELPETLTVYEMGADMHTHINPIEELESMVGKEKIIVLGTE